jgi:hypothetical protein
MTFSADAARPSDPDTDPTPGTDGPMGDQQTHLDTDPVNDPDQDQAQDQDS